MSLEHIAIIMDGNGRWAQKRGKTRIEGHKAGSESLRECIKACIDFQIKHLSVFAFSTENWSRPKAEVSFLMAFFERLLMRETKELDEQGVRIFVRGGREGFSKSLVKIIEKSEQQTCGNDRFCLNFHINYGARDEIVHACRGVVEYVQNHPDVKIDESVFSRFLCMPDTPDPDVLIRTSGEKRLSNYLLWQLAYSELFFVDVLWPDFTKAHLETIIQDFYNRERRFGGVV